ncbi:hypothetical protein NDU88_001172 [Pleurodeles waltl]|uniref:Uncharacterized protein n=1 Tax=Pleurodeles waltl TaxID=8319 RepID=A0AAV7WJP8_PLEWA|nr:hypothetical protein NDU88_001172 [Pleurodeles waltl]
MRLKTLRKKCSGALERAKERPLVDPTKIILSIALGLKSLPRVDVAKQQRHQHTRVRSLVVAPLLPLSYRVRVALYSLLRKALTRSNFM